MQHKDQRFVQEKKTNESFFRNSGHSQYSNQLEKERNRWCTVLTTKELRVRPRKKKKTALDNENV